MDNIEKKIKNLEYELAALKKEYAKDKDPRIGKEFIFLNIENRWLVIGQIGTLEHISTSDPKFRCADDGVSYDYIIDPKHKMSE